MQQKVCWLSLIFISHIITVVVVVVVVVIFVVFVDLFLHFVVLHYWFREVEFYSTFHDLKLSPNSLKQIAGRESQNFHLLTRLILSFFTGSFSFQRKGLRGWRLSSWLNTNQSCFLVTLNTMLILSSLVFILYSSTFSFCFYTQFEFCFYSYALRYTGCSCYN